MSKHRFNEMKDVDAFIEGKLNPPPVVKPKASLDVLKRRAVMRGIRVSLPKLPPK